MLLQLPSGRVIEISVSDYLAMTDLELKEIQTSSRGVSIDDLEGVAKTRDFLDYEDDEVECHIVTPLIEDEIFTDDVDIDLPDAED